MQQVCHKCFCPGFKFVLGQKFTNQRGEKCLGQQKIVLQHYKCICTFQSPHLTGLQCKTISIQVRQYCIIKFSYYSVDWTSTAWNWFISVCEWCRAEISCKADDRPEDCEDIVEEAVVYLIEHKYPDDCSSCRKIQIKKTAEKFVIKDARWRGLLQSMKRATSKLVSALNTALMCYTLHSTIR